MNVNELTDLIVKITRSNKKQQYSRTLANVVNDEKAATIFETLDYVFHSGSDQLSMPKGKYRLGDVVKAFDKNGSGEYIPYWILLSKEQYDKFGREIQYMKNGQCFYTRTLSNEEIATISDEMREDEYFGDLIKDHYGLFVIFDALFDLYTTDENNSAYGVEQIIITYDGVQYIYDKNNVILDEDKNESVSAQSFNLLNKEA